MPTPNYTLGRGKVYFARFTAGQTPGPFRYVGNSPEFSLAVETEMLDHFNAGAVASNLAELNQKYFLWLI